MELYSDQLLPSFADGAKESGRDASRLERMIEVKVSFDTDRSRAMEDTKIWAALALPAEAKAGIDDPREMERLAKTVEDVAHRRWLVSNDAEEHIEQLRPYLELGFDHLVFHAPGDDQVRFLELYGSQILPRLRKQWGG
jgi:coenzyme F420-dependent glucose-6-phosphate dehydrogenase